MERDFGPGIIFLGHDDMVCVSQCHRYALATANKYAILHGPWMIARCSFRRPGRAQLDAAPHLDGATSSLMLQSNRELSIYSGHHTRIRCQCSSISLLLSASHRRAPSPPLRWPIGMACRGHKFDGPTPWCLKLLCPKCTAFPARVRYMTTSTRCLQITLEDTPLCFECSTRMCSVCEDEMDNKAFATCALKGCNRSMCLSCLKWAHHEAHTGDRHTYTPACSLHGSASNNDPAIHNLEVSGALQHLVYSASENAFGAKWQRGHRFEASYEWP